MKRISFRAWGIRGISRDQVPAYARRGPTCSTDIEAVCSAIERKCGLAACAVSPQGTALENGIPESNHFQITLGRRLRAGGYSVEGVLWVAIPI